MKKSFFIPVIVSLALPTAASAASPAEDQAYVERVQQRASNVSIGYDNGQWGQGFGQGLHLDVPLWGDCRGGFGVRVRGVIAYGPSTSSFDPAAFGGAELFGRAPVIFGIARLYGGGGIFVGAPLVAKASRPSTTAHVSGGGHMGIEIFGRPSLSFSVEIGGQGSVDPSGIGAGASVMGGMSFYL